MTIPDESSVWVVTVTDLGCDAESDTIIATFVFNNEDAAILYAGSINEANNRLRKSRQKLVITGSSRRLTNCIRASVIQAFHKG